MTHKSFKVEGKKVLYIKERVLHCSNVRGTLKLRKYKKLPKLHPHPHPTEISATTTLLPCKVIIEKKKGKMSKYGGRLAILNAFEKSSKLKTKNSPTMGNVLKIEFSGMCTSLSYPFVTSILLLSPNCYLHLFSMRTHLDSGGV